MESAIRAVARSLVGLGVKRVIRILIFAVVAGAVIYAAYILGLQARLPKGIIWKLFK